MDRHKILLILSKRIYRTAHTGRPAVEDMGVNHRRLHIFMPEKFLDSANIVAALKEMGCERMAEGVAAGVFCDARFQDGFVDSIL